MSSARPFAWNALHVWLLGATVLSGLVLFALRFSWVFLRSTPLLTGTSGFEEEALFSIWKLKEGMPVYSPLDQVPFSGSYFNGLFYLLYGFVVLGAQNAFHFADVVAAGCYAGTHAHVVSRAWNRRFLAGGARAGSPAADRPFVLCILCGQPVVWLVGDDHAPGHRGPRV
jgi:hypothetical protein